MRSLVVTQFVTPTYRTDLPTRTGVSHASRGQMTSLEDLPPAPALLTLGADATGDPGPGDPLPSALPWGAVLEQRPAGGICIRL